VTQNGHGPSGEGLVWDEHVERICLRNLLASTNEAVYFKDRQSRFLLVNRGVVQHQLEHQQRTGQGHEQGQGQGQGHEQAHEQAHEEGQGQAIGPDDFVGKTDLDFFDAPLAQAWIAEEQAIMETGEPMVDVLERDTWSDNGGGWFRTSKSPLRDDDGTVIGIFGTTRDVTAEVKAERELVLREAQLRAVLDSSPDAIVAYNRELRYEMVNVKALELLGATAEQVRGRSDAELGRSPEVVERLLTCLRRVLATKQGCEMEYSSGTGAGTTWWHVRMVPQLSVAGELLGVITATRDLTALKRAQTELAEQALRDPLTGVFNRLALIDRLNHALAELPRRSGHVALLFIDLDNFKYINDAHGHDAGDVVLIEVATRVARITRPSDTVARLGGDEFVVLLDHLSSADEAVEFAHRVLNTLTAPYWLRGERLPLTASIGVALAGAPLLVAGDLLRDADIAMYRAKDKGRARIEVSPGHEKTVSAPVQQPAPGQVDPEPEAAVHGRLGAHGAHP
jgi:diguanylate cyclase (GGDEF)-like protein/PAS domain S-box-containing protein